MIISLAEYRVCICIHWNISTELKNHFIYFTYINSFLKASIHFHSITFKSVLTYKNIWTSKYQVDIKSPRTNSETLSLYTFPLVFVYYDKILKHYKFKSEFQIN